jgi:hypothetical protein
MSRPAVASTIRCLVVVEVVVDVMPARIVERSIKNKEGPMYGFLVRSLLQRTIAATRRGDIEPHLRNCADAVEFDFPGEHSWTQHSYTKAELRPWLERFARIGLQFYAEKIDVKGPPWNTRVYITFSDHLDAPDGARVYENTGVMAVRARWGKVVYIRVNEDTQRVAALDAWLSVNEPRVAR